MSLMNRRSDGVMKRCRAWAFLVVPGVVGALLAGGCESEPLKPMDEPLGNEDAYRADERMRQNVEEMMEESRRRETPPQGPAEVDR